MTISANTLALLMAAGVEGDELMAIVRSIEADTAPKAKSSGAERQARYRARLKAGSVTSDVTRDVTESVTVTPLTRVGAKPITSQQEPVRKTPSRDGADFRTELSALDADRLDGLLKVRKAKKAPPTGHAARLFIKAAAECALSLSQAADICIERNWLTVKPEWLSKPSARGSPPSTAPNLADAFGALSSISENRHDPRHHASDEGPGRVVPYLSRVQGR